MSKTHESFVVGWRKKSQIQLKIYTVGGVVWFQCPHSIDGVTNKLELFDTVAVVGHAILELSTFRLGPFLFENISLPLGMSEAGHFNHLSMTLSVHFELTC